MATVTRNVSGPERTQELLGRDYRPGQTFWLGHELMEVVEVFDRIHWTEDRIDDMDEFGREPGWYSTLSLRPIEPTEADGPCPALKDEQEWAEKRTRAREEQEAYRAELARISAERDRLIAAQGLIRAEPRGGVLYPEEGVTHRQLGHACEPGRGISCVTELTVYERDGAVVALSCGCPVDSGPAWWLSPALAAEAARRARVWGDWNPRGFHADSYPGPAVPEEELTAEERAEVARLRAEAVVCRREKEEHTIRIMAERAVRRMGLLPADLEADVYSRHVPFLIPEYLESWEVRFGSEFETYVQVHMTRGHSEIQAEGVSIVLRLKPEAFLKPLARSKKPAPAERIPSSLKLHNFCTAAIVIERA